MKRHNVVLLAILLIATAVVSTPVAATTIQSLGSIDFPNSGAPDAQDAFVRGVLLLHSFEYEDAKEAFLEAQQIDPDFALAFWGEAMTYNHPLWRQKNREAALATLARLAPTVAERCAKAGTDRECGYLSAAETLYGEGDKVALDYAYSEEMRRLSAQYPEDLEAKSFYSLSILGTTQGVRDFRVYMRAGAVAEEVFALNPQHPGAAHYLIHSYDDPVHAPLGLRAARVYADIAPAASHAQHMISHIYVALGRWAESVDSNIKSFEVSRERVERKGLEIDELNFHSYSWLQYSYLQMGQWSKARPLLEKMHEYAKESGTPRARGYYASMRASWLVETGDTDIPPTLGTARMGATSAAAELFAVGSSASATGDEKAAQEALLEIDRLLGEATAEAAGRVGEARRQTLQVMADSLRARIAMDAGREPEAHELLANATAIEGEMALSYGPPSIVKPSHELFGELLLRVGQPLDAVSQFEKALDRAPRRQQSLWGLAEAAAGSSNAATADAACSELSSILEGADPQVGLSEICAPRSDAARLD